MKAGTHKGRLFGPECLNNLEHILYRTNFRDYKNNY